MASQSKSDRSPRVVLLGAAPDTGNLGVTALCYTTLVGLADRGINDWVVFDHHTHRYKKLKLDGLPEGRFRVTGSSNSRRYYRSNNLWRQWHLAPCWPFTNPALRAIRRADVVMSLAGGDSFTDLYGKHRFDTVTVAKRIALNMKRPLLLLPQTYGPFRDAQLTPIAADIIRNASLAWARDEESYHLMRGLADEKFLDERYMLGVDMAFALPMMEPPAKMRDRVEAMVDRSSGPVVGFNVSGLLYNDPEKAMKQYGLKANYLEVVSEFLMRLLTQTQARIVLVPHVITPPGHYESDIEASQKLQISLTNALAAQGRMKDAERIFVADAFDHPSNVKWLIDKCDWFCGTRMHSTIAALSSGTPCAAIAYSKKTYGVFAQCGVGNQVVDPRQQDSQPAVEALWETWTQRNITQKRLTQVLPTVLAQGEAQLDRMASFCMKHRR